MTTFASLGYTNSTVQTMDESSSIMASPPRENRSDFKLTGLNEGLGKKPSILLVQHKKKMDMVKVDTKERIFPMAQLQPGLRILPEGQENRNTNIQSSRVNTNRVITGDGVKEPRPRAASNPQARNLTSNIF